MLLSTADDLSVPNATNRAPGALSPGGVGTDGGLRGEDGYSAHREERLKTIPREHRAPCPIDVPRGVANMKLAVPAPDHQNEMAASPGRWTIRSADLTMHGCHHQGTIMEK